MYGGLVTENVIQKLAYLVLTRAIRNIDDNYGYKLATTTHDEVLYVVSKDDKEALENVLREMKDPPEWCKDLPLGAEGFEGPNYDK
jgi:DNA polymerase